MTDGWEVSSSTRARVGLEVGRESAHEMMVLDEMGRLKDQE